MAESPLERLKRLGAEKRAMEAAAAGTTVTAPSVETKVDVPKVSIASQIAAPAAEIKNESTSICTSNGPVCDDGGLESSTGVPSQSNAQSVYTESGEDLPASSAASMAILHSPNDSGCGERNVETIPTELTTATPSDHPLSMQFAELEQLLLVDEPGFKVLLRDVHRKLGTEPELVTMMTEDEVQLVVRGMVHLANAEIIEPGKAKAAKSAVAAAKKKVITEDDL